MYIYTGLEIGGYTFEVIANHFGQLIRQIFWLLRITFGRLRITFSRLRITFRPIIYKDKKCK